MPQNFFSPKNNFEALPKKALKIGLLSIQYKVKRLIRFSAETSRHQQTCHKAICKEL